MEERVMSDEELFGGGLPDVPEEGEDELDEDLIGLTPEELEAELKRRADAAKEEHTASERLISEGEGLLERGAFEEAAEKFREARVHEASAKAESLYVCALTKNYEDSACFYEEGIAEEVSFFSEEAHADLMERMGERLLAEREEYRGEEGPLSEKVERSAAERREAFKVNRDYYLVRFLICLAAWVLPGLGAAVSGSFILRVAGAVPLIVCLCFGGAALVAFGVFCFFARKLFVAQKLCSDNEKLSSTEDGKRLLELRARIEALTLVLEGPRQDE